VPLLARGAWFRECQDDAMTLSQATPAVVHDARTARAISISGRPSISVAARSIADGLCERFEESPVLVRSFLTVPCQDLPGRRRGIAAGLARSVQLEDLLTPRTPVLSLLATRGSVSDWNDPRESRGHAAIPFLSESFVASIPMLAMLLEQPGLPPTWVQDRSANMRKWMTGHDAGPFYAERPASAIDELGRKIAPAREFAAGHAVRSAFPAGGAVFGGAVFVPVFFGRDPAGSRTARAFPPLVNQVKGAPISRRSMSRVFLPENAAGRDAGNGPGPLPGGGEA
jgi:hypothetical protein